MNLSLDSITLTCFSTNQNHTILAGVLIHFKGCLSVNMRCERKVKRQ